MGGKMIRVNVYIFCVCLAIGFSFISGEANAQNFATMVPTDTESELMNDEPNIEQILQQQGIPLLPNMEMPFETSSTYTLGPLDVIEINVMRHPEVTGNYILNKEGMIQYEFIGDLEISGMTKDETVDVVTEQLSKYIISPEVTVKILQYNSKVVYVIGEVGRPGKIFMRGDTITVREALVEAGLPMLSANTPKSKVITPEATGKPLQRKVNVHKLLYEGDLRENIVMSPGDTLYVPPTGWAKAMRMIRPVAEPIAGAAGAARTVTYGF